jgi:hypothetical protein
VTDQELLALYHKRQDALDQIFDGPTQVLGEMAPEKRKHADGLSALFRRVDSKITAELCLRNAPAQLDGVTLHLTQDRLNWVPLQPGTLRPVLYGDSPYVKTPLKGTFYRYPREALRP